MLISKTQLHLNMTRTNTSPRLGLRKGKMEEPKNRKCRIVLQRFSCSDCGRKFQFESALKSHFDKHSSDRLFICSLCPLTYKRKFDLRRHEETCQGSFSNPPIVNTNPNGNVDPREQKYIDDEAKVTADIEKTNKKLQKLHFKLRRIQSLRCQFQTAATQQHSGNIYHLAN